MSPTPDARPTGPAAFDLSGTALGRADGRNALAALSGRLDGDILLPGDAGWDDARAAWNLAVDQHPAAVVLPRSVRDLRRVIVAAREDGLGVTVQPRGHGASDSLSGRILVRTTAFDEITVNVVGRYARVGAGVPWGTLLNRLDGSGLVALAGSNPDVSVAGYLLSGGHSWFSRWKGLASHSIRAVELLDATGVLRRVSRDTDPELLWALRGAAGLFGVVTALEIDLFSAPDLFGGKLLFPAESAEVVFGTASDILLDAPPELSLMLGLINMPDIEQVPELLRGRSFAQVDAVFVGSAEAGEALLAPLHTIAPVIADLTRPFPIGQLGEVSGEPQEPSATLDWSRSVTDLDPATMAGLVAAFRTASYAGLTLLQLRPLGGLIGDPTVGQDGVAGHLDTTYLLFAAAILPPGAPIPAPADRHLIFQPLEDTLQGVGVPRTVPSFLAAGQDLSFAFAPDVLKRLAALKRTVDPENLFRSNHPLPEEDG
ncbi:FAD-binding oxidoreductase [Cryobacterium sp. PAMC25264]|uniref:FAD-dependent oxidoreductase n=1 Tax=Cryobacterium sp. PAMC25264 TaxID=2861288 RepID=UPI001C62ED0F|nr:FAD-binding oxidoreductase [Cryobacterium sp. PAMC25264]QYF75155.1 FAD-binding oxidoreductase [Cryobacterium sp. PAMC25264]